MAKEAPGPREKSCLGTAELCIPGKAVKGLARCVWRRGGICSGAALPGTALAEKRAVGRGLDPDDSCCLLLG